MIIIEIKVLKHQIGKLSASRKTHILAYRGAIYNLKGCPIVHWITGKYVFNQMGSHRFNWIIGRLHAKNQGPKSRDKPSRQTLWFMEGLFAIKRDVLKFTG